MKAIKIKDIYNIIYRLISTILCFNIWNLTKNNFNYDITFMQDLSIFRIGLSLIVIFVVISILKHFIKNKYIDYILAVGFLFMCSLLWLNDNNIFFIVCLFLVFLLLYHFRPNDLNINLKKISNLCTVVIIASGIVMFLHIAILGILRYKLFDAPNFDLGIPGQNFYYLKKMGVPFSTCERDMFVNHLTIHFSLIYYLILPIYFIFSHVTLFPIISALLISSGIIPIYFLCKKNKLTRLITIIICLIYATYIGAICSTYYDFHENHFLIPLLLWLFYFYEKKKNVGIYLFSFLVLLVKEDAPIYIIIFSFFMILDKNARYGLPILIASLLYFMTATYFIKTYGEGIMIYRYSNLAHNDSGMIGIIKTIIINPGYFIKQLIASPENITDKFKYILQLLLPLGFIPLFSKEKKNYILLIPLLLTIMTTYQYSYNINFHYSCGIIAFLFYLFIKNIKDLKIDNYLLICLIFSILTYRAYAFPYLYDEIKKYNNEKQELIQVEKLLKEIPQEASVNASAFMLPHLTERDTIYEVYYHGDATDVDYVVLDARDNDYTGHYNIYVNNGYVKDKEIWNKVVILKK